MNLENSIKDCITKELEKGIVEKVISDKLEECISSSLKDMFSWGGEVKKVIENKVKSVMIPYLESYDYSKYICKLDSVLVEVLKDTTLENKKLLENFKELMISEEILREVKITQIYETWCDYCKKNIDRDKIEDYGAAHGPLPRHRPPAPHLRGALSGDDPALPGDRRLGAAPDQRRLRRQLPIRTDGRPDRYPGRIHARRADHKVERRTPPSAEHPPVDGRFDRPLGR
jgi:uncharacterized protein Yka (UPF0111/DUF47 family)